MLCASETEKDSCQGDSGGAEDCPDKDDDDDDDENDDDDDKNDDDDDDKNDDDNRGIKEL